MEKKTGKTTGPKPCFSKQDVIDTVFAIGINKFTLNSVAKKLNLSAPAIYRVVKTRAELVELCLAQAGKELETIPTGLSWQAYLLHWSRACWDLGLKYPGIAEVILTFPGAHIHIQKTLHNYFSALLANNIPGGLKSAQRSMAIIGRFTLSLVLTHEQLQMKDDNGIPIIEVAMEKFSNLENPIYPLHSDITFADIRQCVELIIDGVGIQ